MNVCAENCAADVTAVLMFAVLPADGVAACDQMKHRGSDGKI